MTKRDNKEYIRLKKQRKIDLDYLNKRIIAVKNNPDNNVYEMSEMIFILYCQNKHIWGCQQVLSNHFGISRQRVNYIVKSTELNRPDYFDNHKKLKKTKLIEKINQEVKNYKNSKYSVSETVYHLYYKYEKYTLKNLKKILANYFFLDIHRVYQIVNNHSFKCKKRKRVSKLL